MFNYSLDFTKFASDMLPPRRRKTKFIAMLTVLIGQIKVLHTQFAGSGGLMAVVNDKLDFTGQVCYLETLLNREFCGGLNLITIDDTYQGEKLYLYNTIEEQTDTYLYGNDEAGFEQVYINNNSDVFTEDDFVVNVPSSVKFRQADMLAILKYYVQAGKKYSIITV